MTTNKGKVKGVIPKFRVWHKRQKIMFYNIGNLTFRDDIWDGVVQDSLKNWEGLCLDDENSILMQSTGLKDKNGKEIFEGDIVRGISTDKSKHIFRIVWDEIMWAGNTKDDIVVLDDFGFDRKYNIEVIGNIHENPELLKKER